MTRRRLWLIDDAKPSLAGAILALAYATDETTARYWLAVCARRGADWTLQRELWATWQAEHTPQVITPDPRQEQPR